jgi:hypothetical protein
MMDAFEIEMAQELELNKGMYAVIHLLSSPHWGDKEQADGLGSALVGYESKYGRALIRDIENAIGEVVYEFSNRITEGEEHD